MAASRDRQGARDGSSSPESEALVTAPTSRRNSNAIQVNNSNTHTRGGRTSRAPSSLLFGTEERETFDNVALVGRDTAKYSRKASHVSSLVSRREHRGHSGAKGAKGDAAPSSSSSTSSSASNSASRKRTLDLESDPSIPDELDILTNSLDRERIRHRKRESSSSSMGSQKKRTVIHIDLDEQFENPKKVMKPPRQPSSKSAISITVRSSSNGKNKTDSRESSSEPTRSDSSVSPLSTSPKSTSSLESKSINTRKVASRESEVEPPPKRKRGRPKKVRPTIDESPIIVPEKSPKVEKASEQSLTEADVSDELKQFIDEDDAMLDFDDDEDEVEEENTKEILQSILAEDPPSEHSDEDESATIALPVVKDHNPTVSASPSSLLRGPSHKFAKFEKEFDYERIQLMRKEREKERRRKREERERQLEDEGLGPALERMTEVVKNIEPVHGSIVSHSTNQKSLSPVSQPRTITDSTRVDTIKLPTATVKSIPKKSLLTKSSTLTKFPRTFDPIPIRTVDIAKDGNEQPRLHSPFMMMNPSVSSAAEPAGVPKPTPAFLAKPPSNAPTGPRRVLASHRVRTLNKKKVTRDLDFLDEESSSQERAHKPATHHNMLFMPSKTQQSTSKGSKSDQVAAKLRAR